MHETLRIKLGEEIINVGNKIKAGTSELTEDEAVHLMSVVTHQPMAREEACDYINVNPNKFYDLITLGKLPKGRKRKSLKEKVWYKDELDKAINKLKLKRKETNYE